MIENKLPIQSKRKLNHVGKYLSSLQTTFLPHSLSIPPNIDGEISGQIIKLYADEGESERRGSERD